MPRYGREPSPTPDSGSCLPAATGASSRGRKAGTGRVGARAGGREGARAQGRVGARARGREGGWFTCRMWQIRTGGLDLPPDARSASRMRQTRAHGLDLGTECMVAGTAGGHTACKCERRTGVALLRLVRLESGRRMQTWRLVKRRRDRHRRAPEQLTDSLNGDRADLLCLSLWVLRLSGLRRAPPPQLRARPQRRRCSGPRRDRRTKSGPGS
jgi:hypothetical protein